MTQRLRNCVPSRWLHFRASAAPLFSLLLSLSILLRSSSFFFGIFTLFLCFAREARSCFGRLFSGDKWHEESNEWELGDSSNVSSYESFCLVRSLSESNWVVTRWIFWDRLENGNGKLLQCWRWLGVKADVCNEHWLIGRLVYTTISSLRLFRRFRRD